MRQNLRARYHTARKALAGRVEGLWPSVLFSDVTETVFERDPEARSFEPLPSAFPEQARSFVARAGLEKNAERVYRTTVPCTIDPKMGILFAGSKVVWGSSDIPDRERGPSFHRHLSRPSLTLPAGILLHHFHSDNYFHFIFYVLTKVHLAEKAGLPADVPFVLPEKTAGTVFFRQARDLGVFGKREVVVQGRKQVLAVDRAFLIRERFCDPQAMDWLCDRFSVPMAAPQNRRLLVVRAKDAANGRSWRNQAEVEATAARFGFEAVDPGTLPLKDQARLFSEASVVVGAHGAGLTNLVFRRHAPGHLVELFSPQMGGAHYFMIARAKGFGYDSLLTRNPEGRDFRATTEVDCADLERVLGAL
ncbi:hypothetical protein GCM10011316_36340 [Roseibium aquae]|uniref:Glycosyltransferase 61 catalytic domain-containing protein n=1 Tax=Roseibium aquae TaxID=1323746 RepID=A0A916TMT8_9HYPH|nr:glycosyltransferase family 61 protein [Roseibium aquae]GGB61064.1 hypothetical protein GCM10011316_36340 [Roseibium aquae]